VQAQLAAASGALPQAARGTARLRFTVLASGGVAGMRLLESSGNAELDAAALSLPTRTAPFPVPPSGEAMTLEVPLRVQ
jgi:TonB family protein